MPHEVEAELAGGMLPKELTAEHQARAIELGLYATNMPASVGGPGCTALQQVLVQEQCGRVTNGLGWVMAHPAAVVGGGGDRLPARAVAAAGGARREARGVRDHRGVRRLRRVRAADHRTPRRRRVRRQRRQVARHVVQPRRLRLRPGGASDGGDHVLLVVDLPWPGVEVVRTPQYSHHIADEHPIVAFNDVRVPGGATSSGPRADR